MEEANENTKELLRQFSEQNEKKETLMNKRLRADAVDQYAVWPRRRVRPIIHLPPNVFWRNKWQPLSKNTIWRS
jgi:hypothetical protein